MSPSGLMVDSPNATFIQTFGARNITADERRPRRAWTALRWARAARPLPQAEPRAAAGEAERQGAPKRPGSADRAYLADEHRATPVRCQALRGLLARSSNACASCCVGCSINYTRVNAGGCTEFHCLP